MEVYIIYTTTYVCKQRVVALLLMELLSKMRKMRTITPPDAIIYMNLSQRAIQNDSFFQIFNFWPKTEFFFKRIG